MTVGVGCQGEGVVLERGWGKVGDHLEVFDDEGGNGRWSKERGVACGVKNSCES